MVGEWVFYVRWCVVVDGLETDRYCGGIKKDGILFCCARLMKTLAVWRDDRAR